MICNESHRLSEIARLAALKELTGKVITKASFIRLAEKFGTLAEEGDHAVFNGKNCQHIYQQDKTGITLIGMEPAGTSFKVSPAVSVAKSVTDEQMIEILSLLAMIDFPMGFAVDYIKRQEFLELTLASVQGRSSRLAQRYPDSPLYMFAKERIPVFMRVQHLVTSGVISI